MPVVLLTRPHKENLRIAPLFQQRGFRVLQVPLIELRPIPPDYSILSAWRADASATDASATPPILLTSNTATELWIRLIANTPVADDSLRYLVVGNRSTQLLRKQFPSADIESVANSGAELLRQLRQLPSSILYPCSIQRRDELVEGLRSKGVRVMEFPLYKPELPANAAQRLREAVKKAGDTAGLPLCITFFSPSAVANFISLQPELPPGAIFAAVGKTTAMALHGYGISEVVTPAQPNAAMLADAILDVIEQQ